VNDSLTGKIIGGELRDSSVVLRETDLVLEPTPVEPILADLKYLSQYSKQHLIYRVGIGTLA
jgi:hypothetical protein